METEQIVDTERIIDGYFLPFDTEIETLAQQLRKYLKNETNPTTELVGPSTLSVNFGYGFTRKPWDCYCAIIAYSKHINISFPSGTSLDDPEGLLVGKGSRIRHVRVNKVEDLKVPAIKKFLLQARDKAFNETKNSPTRQDKFRTYVKKS